MDCPGSLLEGLILQYIWCTAARYCNPQPVTHGQVPYPPMNKAGTSHQLTDGYQVSFPASYYLPVCSIMLRNCDAAPTDDRSLRCYVTSFGIVYSPRTHQKHVTHWSQPNLGRLFLLFLDAIYINQTGKWLQRLPDNQNHKRYFPFRPCHPQ